MRLTPLVLATILSTATLASDNTSPVLSRGADQAAWVDTTAMADDGSIALVGMIDSASSGSGNWDVWVRLLPQGGTVTECHFAHQGLGTAYGGYQPNGKLLVASMNGGETQLDILRLAAGACQQREIFSTPGTCASLVRRVFIFVLSLTGSGSITMASLLKPRSAVLE